MGYRVRWARRGEVDVASRLESNRFGLSFRSLVLQRTTWIHRRGRSISTVSTSKKVSRLRTVLCPSKMIPPRGWLTKDDPLAIERVDAALDQAKRNDEDELRIIVGES